MVRIKSLLKNIVKIKNIKKKMSIYIEESGYLDGEYIRLQKYHIANCEYKVQNRDSEINIRK